MPHSFPHIHDPTVLGIELHLHPESTCLYFETLPANAHGMHQNMIHNNMFVFKKGVQTVWHPVCSMLPTLSCSPGWWHNSSPKKNMIQYFTANVLLYKLDVWCSLFDVSPQHWAWWFIMKLCLAAGLSKCVLYIIELLFEWFVMLFHVISDIPFFDVWCRK